MDNFPPHNSTSSSSAGKSPSGAPPSASMPRTAHASKTASPLTENDRRALDTALVAGNWTAVDHLLFQRHLSLPGHESVFRALVVDTSDEAVAFFRKLLHRELRLLQIHEGEQRAAIESGLTNTLELAVKHGNKAVLRIILGEDSKFNQLVKHDLPNQSRFQSTGFLGGLRKVACHLQFGKSHADENNRAEHNLSVERHAIGFAGKYGRFDLAEVVLSRVVGLGAHPDPLLSEGMAAAASHGHIEFVRSILRLKPTVRASGPALLAAANENRSDIVALLRDTCTAPDLLAAAIGATANGHFQLGQSLSPNSSLRGDMFNEALKAAAERGSLAAVRDLLRLGAQAKHGNSEALKRAAKGGHAAICSTLIAAGADPCSLTVETLSDLDAKGHTALVVSLVDGMLKGGRDASNFFKPSGGRSHTTVLTHCIQNGLDLTKWGDVILQGALESADLQMITALRDRGVDIRAYAARLMPLRHATKPHQIRSLLLIAFNTSPGWSQLPENLVDIITKMDQTALIEGLLPLLAKRDPEKNNSNAMYDFLIASSLRSQLKMISPTQSEQSLNERIARQYQILQSKTPAKRQFLNRVTELGDSLAGIHWWTTEIADSLLLGIEQTRAGESARNWTPTYIRDRRANLKRLTGEFLLSTHDLPDISRLYKLSMAGAKKMPIAARPLLYGDPEWTPLVSVTYRAPNGCTVTCLKNDKDLKHTGNLLDNCIKEPGYVTESYSGNTSVFKVTSPQGTIIAAFELKRGLTGPVVGTDGSRWWESQFKGPSNGAPCEEATVARDAFYRALANKEFETNRVRASARVTAKDSDLPVEFITGVPIGGSIEMIKEYYKSFGVTGKDGSPALLLVPPGTALHKLINK